VAVASTEKKFTVGGKKERLARNKEGDFGDTDIWRGHKRGGSEWK
jgi:hypothetical protein